MAQNQNQTEPTFGEVNVFAESWVLVVTERVVSCASLLAILFILTTYTFYPAFRKPINRLIFFATWGNLGLSVASLISIYGPQSGPETPLCNFQGFMVQMFVGVDVWWALCMSINVYLAFFRGRTVAQLQAMEVRYLIACYGVSFVPAFIFIFFSLPGKSQPIYGDATIWCWISGDWLWLRIVVVYALIWVALLASLVVYIRVGRVIWKKRPQLDGFLNPWNESPFIGTIGTTTEIQITTESRNGFNDLIIEDPAVITGDDDRRYKANIESAAYQKRTLPAMNVRSISRDVAINEENAEAWLYARAAFLFFIALAITWIPASVLRIYEIVNDGRWPNFGLAYTASLLFPMQGLWNAIVYIITSRTACKDFWSSVVYVTTSRTAWKGLWNSIRRRKSCSLEESIKSRQLSASYRRAKSGSFQTDEEELNPKIIISKDDIRTDSTMRLHGQESRECVPVDLSHDTTTRSSVAEQDETIELPSYRRQD